MNKPIDILQKYWGYASFRPQQEEIITSILDGHDSLAILPTGGGKSLCFQIPGLILEGVTLVISPLIALMTDQVQDLQFKNIPAAVIHSGMPSSQITQTLEDAIRGELKFIYCSPERLQQDLFLDYAMDIPWSLLVIDEAHCISEWGHDFRPSYLKINTFQSSLPHSIPTAAFTASATEKVRQEIISELKLSSPQLFIQDTFRANLAYHVIHAEQKEWTLLNRLQASSNIIYCPTRKNTEQLSQFLIDKGYNCNYYHAGLSSKERQWVQSQWLQSASQTICSTNAFGMGINKPNVRQVFHLHAPHSLEAYYQEAGRAGRDGLHADAYLILRPHDIKNLHKSIELNFPPYDTIIQVYNIICNHLKISIGDGFEEKYFIDLAAVAHHYNINIFHILASIQTLEHEEYWSFQLDDISQHHVQINCNREEMNFIERHSPTLYTVMIQMLRLYGDIIQNFTPISIEIIAQLLNTTYDDISLRLQQLEQKGYIKWQKYKRGSSLFFLQARVPTNFIIINKNRLARRQKVFEEKLLAMQAYIDNTTDCRQQIIARYFGFDKTTTCQICDNCRRQHFIKNKATFAKNIFKIIKAHQPISTKNILSHIDDELNEQQLKSIIQELLVDDLIQINEDVITLKK